MEKLLTEQEVRQIAREEAMKVQKGLVSDVKEIKKDLKNSNKVSSENRESLKRLERMLMGEFAGDSKEALKGRADFAYQYAKRNTDLRICERAIPALEWFERVNVAEPGEGLSMLEKMGKIVNVYDRLSWLIAVIGVSSITTAIVAINIIKDWIQSWM